jgi:hypothetical protein
MVEESVLQEQARSAIAGACCRSFQLSILIFATALTSNSRHANLAKASSIRTRD